MQHTKTCETDTATAGLWGADGQKGFQSQVAQPDMAAQAGNPRAWKTKVGDCKFKASLC